MFLPEATLPRGELSAILLPGLDAPAEVRNQATTVLGLLGISSSLREKLADRVVVPL